MKKSEAATITAWEPWQRLGYHGSLATICFISGVKAQIEWHPESGYEGRFGHAYTKPYPTLEQACKALEQAIYRHVTKEEHHLRDVRKAMNEGITVPMVPDKAVITEQS